MRLTHARLLNDSSGLRYFVSRAHMAANDASAAPSSNRAVPIMRKCGGAGIQSHIFRDCFGLTDRMPVSWSGVYRTVMETAIPPSIIMSHPTNRTGLRRNCNRMRRSNRRATSLFGDFIVAPWRSTIARVGRRAIPRHQAVARYNHFRPLQRPKR